MPQDNNAHAYIMTLIGAKNIDGGLAFVDEKVAPLLRQQHGYRGLTASADRAGGVFGMLSLWESAAERDAGESVLGKLGEEARDLIGGDVVVETYEALVADLVRPPATGSALVLTHIRMDPARIDGNIASFRSEVLPKVKAKPGYLGLFNMVNRKTGQGVVSQAWVDEQAMESAEADRPALELQAAADGVTCGDVSRRQVVFADLP
jgi:hypothetical protein